MLLLWSYHWSSALLLYTFRPSGTIKQAGIILQPRQGRNISSPGRQPWVSVAPQIRQPWKGGRISEVRRRLKTAIRLYSSINLRIA